MKSPAKVENTILRVKRKLELKSKNKALKPKMHCVSEIASRRKKPIVQRTGRPIKAVA